MTVGIPAKKKLGIDLTSDSFRKISRKPISEYGLYNCETSAIIHVSRMRGQCCTRIRLRSPSTPHTPPTRAERPTSIDLRPVKVSSFFSCLYALALALATRESSTTPVTCMTSFAARTLSRSLRLVSGFLGRPCSLYC